MPALGPGKLPYPDGLPKLKDLKTFMERSTRTPTTGVTQGGSSRKGAGARVAATDGLARPEPYTGESNV